MKKTLFFILISIFSIALFSCKKTYKNDFEIREGTYYSNTTFHLDKPDNSGKYSFNDFSITFKEHKGSIVGHNKRNIIRDFKTGKYYDVKIVLNNIENGKKEEYNINFDLVNGGNNFYKANEVKTDKYIYFNFYIYEREYTKDDKKHLESEIIIKKDNNHLSFVGLTYNLKFEKILD